MLNACLRSPRQCHRSLESDRRYRGLLRSWSIEQSASSYSSHLRRPAMSEATPPPVSPSVSIARYPPTRQRNPSNEPSQWCRAAIALLVPFQVRDPPVPRGLLRSWRYGSSADRQVALGSAHVQNAQRGDRGRTWGRVHVNGERVKPSKAVRTGDTIEVTIKTFRHTLVVTG